MSKKFKCTHCHRIIDRNPRLKGKQSYCGSKECQQARKNSWEKEKHLRDPTYKAKRKEAQKRYHQKRPRDQYQSNYRQEHPEYCQDNKEKQIFRNQQRKSASLPKIVNTDAMIEKGFVAQGLYAIIPCKNTDAKKIVNTDALFVQMYAAQGFGEYFMSNTV